MTKLYITVWSSPEERPEHLVESTIRHTGLSFSTSAHGGFGDASFTVQTSGWNAVRWYRSYLGFHVVIFDHYGRRVYEGSIEDTEVASDGVSVTVLGYFSNANELTHGLVYPDTLPLTPTKLVTDTVDIAANTSGLWQADYSMIESISHNIAPQDFSQGKKLSDAIEVSIRYGNDAIKPLPMYFAIWDHRRAFFYAEPSVASEPDWRVYMRDMSLKGQTLSRSRSNVWNKIQIIYDDPDIGTAFTPWAEDKDSQRLFRIREGSMSIGSAQPGEATVIRDLAINAYAYPEQTSQADITGRIYNKAGAPDMPYMVRAGGTIRVMDYDPTVAQLVSGSTGADSATAFISRTSYSAEDNTLTVELGRKSRALDLLMARLGKDSGSVS